ncbi:MAG: hypothetical protein IAE79_21850 [Anaerolinea sp.]|nr:hypothetical protein [Anaerolinea sp.]
MKRFFLGFVILSLVIVMRVAAQNETETNYLYLPMVQRPYPFAKTAFSPFYLQNFANNAGCNWLGMAGEVLDTQGQPASPGVYWVHVWGSGIDNRVMVGSAPDYSPAGWEQFLFGAPVVRDYLIQLETGAGTAVSPIYPVQTRASCNENLVRFDFYELP